MEKTATELNNISQSNGCLKGLAALAIYSSQFFYNCTDNYSMFIKKIRSVVKMIHSN